MSGDVQRCGFGDGEGVEGGAVREGAAECEGGGGREDDDDCGEDFDVYECWDGGDVDCGAGGHDGGEYEFEYEWEY